MSKKGTFDHADVTRSGLAKLESEWKGSVDEPNIKIPNNPFFLKFQKKIKNKEVNPGKVRSAKEDRELKQKIVDEVWAEWEKVNGTPRTPQLRIKKGKGS